MGIFARWRERFPIIKFLTEAQKTVWYPILFAALCIIGGTHNYKVYIPILWLLLSMHLFSVLFADDNKVFLTPLCMIFFALGCDAPANAYYESHEDLMSYMAPQALGHIIAIAIIGVGSFVIRLMLDGSISAALKKPRFFTVSIIAMDIAFLLSGIFSKDYCISDLGYGALLAMGFTVVYFFASGMLERSHEPVKYGCTVMLCTAYTAFLQILTVILRLHSNGKYIVFQSDGYVYMNKNFLTLGWGVSTVIGAVFVLGIPAAMYLARNCKLSFITFFSCPLFILGTVLINTRNAMLVSILAFGFCALLCCINGENRMKIRIYTLICLIIGVIGILYVHFYIKPLDSILDFLRFEASGGDNGRFSMWTEGFENFKSSPLFGVGFTDGTSSNFYSEMHHCIFIQIIGAMGIVGAIAFFIHIIQLIIMFFKRISIDKMLLLMLPLMIIALSVLDNFFFYLHFQIFYGVFLTISEHLYIKGNKDIV